MLAPKDILVVTTSTIEGRSIKKHVKPVTAHIVAGTNFFSDMFAAFSDFFGGRSSSYQKQLTSLYDEAIHSIKLAAYEIGANAVVGLSIDMDEISGKNKSMFMLTAIGTAVVLENNVVVTPAFEEDEKFENVSYEKLNNLYRKRDYLKKAQEDNLTFNDDSWKFFTDNRMEEIFPFLIKKYQTMVTGVPQNELKDFYDRLLMYIDAFPEEKKVALVYSAILTEKNKYNLALLSKVVNDLNLLDLNYAHQVIGHDDFNTQKIGLQITTFNKPFYNREDIELFNAIKEQIASNFKERGTRTTKKQLLSSKEREVWICECGNTNDVPGYSAYCDGCFNDIFGFKANDVTPAKAATSISTKVELISELVG
ncbi:YbjQ family protein [Mucilaginibacter sp. PAMB04274]|uniref:YbjQ family protein n=1 Tax=Mucilaginibacter sp. PAMB04274 TaxID=3138568 RepID=UPI0031F61B94